MIYGANITGIEIGLPKEAMSNQELAKALSKRQERIEKELQEKEKVLKKIEENLSADSLVKEWLEEEKRKLNSIKGKFIKDREKGEGSQFVTSEGWIEDRTKIKQRYIASDEQATSDLATIAAENALRMSGLKKDKVEAIILATVTPDYFTSPATSAIIQDNLKISFKLENKLREIFCVDMTSACTSFTAALFLSYGLIRAGLRKNVLLIGADVMSRVLSPYDRSVLPIFGDGAFAMVLEASQGLDLFSPDWFFCGADGSKAQRIIVPAGGSRLPVTEEIIGDPFDQRHKVKMEGNQVFKEIVSRVKNEVIPQALEKAHLQLKDIKLLIFHQANQRMTEAIMKRFAESQTYSNIQRYGNTTSASVGLCLFEAWQEGILKADDKVMLVTFGGGYTWLTTIFRWPYLPEEIPKPK